MPRGPLRKCPVCDEKLVYDDKNDKNQVCRRCKLTVTAFDLNLRISTHYKDRDEETPRQILTMAASQARRTECLKPGSRQLITVTDDNKCFVTWRRPENMHRIVDDDPVDRGKRGYRTWRDAEGRGPPVRWRGWLTIGNRYGPDNQGVRAFIPKSLYAIIADGDYQAAVVRQRDYIYLAFKIERQSAR